MMIWMMTYHLALYYIVSLRRFDWATARFAQVFHRPSLISRLRPLIR